VVWFLLNTVDGYSCKKLDNGRCNDYNGGEMVHDILMEREKPQVTLAEKFIVVYNSPEMQGLRYKIYECGL